MTVKCLSRTRNESSREIFDLGVSRLPLTVDYLIGSVFTAVRFFWPPDLVVGTRSSEKRRNSRETSNPHRKCREGYSCKCLLCFVCHDFFYLKTSGAIIPFVRGRCNRLVTALDSSNLCARTLEITRQKQFSGPHTHTHTHARTHTYTCIHTRTRTFLGSNIHGRNLKWRRN